MCCVLPFELPFTDYFPFLVFAMTHLNVSCYIKDLIFIVNVQFAFTYQGSPLTMEWWRSAAILLA